MKAHTQRGFSLVELMVAMTLSLILMAGALSILYSSKITYNENDRIARLQEAGRAALDLMTRDARGAGYPGCSRPNAAVPFVNKLTNSAGLLWNFGQPVFGFQATGSGWTPAMDALINTPTAVTGTDVLVLRGARQGESVFRTTLPVTTAGIITVAGNAGATIVPPTPMLISDCTGSTVFSATGFNAGTGVVAHAQGGSEPANVNAALDLVYQIAAQVIPVQTTIYYVGNDGANRPALFRKVGTAPAQALVDGVENMQLQFGIDTDTDLKVNNYVTADSVTDWTTVVSVTIALLIRTPDETGTEKDKRTYKLLDAATIPAAGDRRQRALFITTVGLRNMAE